MKTLTALTLATVIAIGFTAPAQANTITDNLTEVVSNQLAELGNNIKQQAKTALEKTATELFFSNGSEQAVQHVTKTAGQTSDSKK
ncbi:CheY-specific phosphatase CheX [Rheinheimera pacifica]|mgnify:FL=1|uniref:hypothetical protein n=1 Tax=Rheinheimera pacifica TaxID=173990 RepID=UPI00216A7E98|nr:hypothetical protein [Rheinheimera pacifica]MCS4307695.1 CheY-specific phosphatase CheX [Rheinheimera pacifica]